MFIHTFMWAVVPRVTRGIIIIKAHIQYMYTGIDYLTDAIKIKNYRFQTTSWLPVDIELMEDQTQHGRRGDSVGVAIRGSSHPWE